MKDPGAGTDELTAIYEGHFDHVWRSLRRFGVPARHLEDMAQEVFIVVHRRLGDFDRSRPIKPWLTGIAWKVAADHRKKAAERREEPSDAIEAVDPDPGVEARLDQKKAEEMVHRALDALDEDKRLVFVMHDLDGCSMPEIAEIVGAPINTLYSRLRLARARFTAEIAAERGGNR